jgi:hypothetical protein
MYKPWNWGSILRVAGLLAVPSVMAIGQATSYVLPQVEFGGGWYSQLYFTNQNSTPASFSIVFYTATGAALNVPSLKGNSTVVNLPANGSASIEASSAGPMAEGWASFFLPTGVSGYAVLRDTVARHTWQEAVVPFTSAAATTDSLVWDDTNPGAQTLAAMVNGGSAEATVTVTVLDNKGNTLGTSSTRLASHTQIVEALESLKGLSGMTGTWGTATFVASAGNVSVLGLRFDALAFSSIPVTTNVPPDGPVTGTVPSGTLVINSQFLPLYFPSEMVNFTITPTGETFSSTFPQGTVLVGGTASVQGSGTVLTFSTLQSAPNSWYTLLNVVFPVIISGSMNLTVTQVSTDPKTGVSVGNVSGLLTVTGSDLSGGTASLSGPIFGTYVEAP